MRLSGQYCRNCQPKNKQHFFIIAVRAGDFIAQRHPIADIGVKIRVFFAGCMAEARRPPTIINNMTSCVLRF